MEKLLSIRDAANKLCHVAGAATIGKVLNASDAIGDSWVMLACIDYLVEIGEFEYADQKYSTQDWILRKTSEDA